LAFNISVLRSRYKPYNNRFSCRKFAEYSLCVKSNGYSLLHRAARLILCTVSTLPKCVCLFCLCHRVHGI